jgi:hypothetical protein
VIAKTTGTAQSTMVASDNSIRPYSTSYHHQTQRIQREGRKGPFTGPIDRLPIGHARFRRSGAIFVAEGRD